MSKEYVHAFCYKNNGLSYKKEDKIYNRFARALLMPKDIFIYVFNEYTQFYYSPNSPSKIIDKLSYKFKVPREQVVERMHDLNLFE